MLFARQKHAQLRCALLDPPKLLLWIGLDAKADVSWLQSMSESARVEEPTSEPTG